MRFLKLDKKKGSGSAPIAARYAYLIYVEDIAYFPETDEKGVRLDGDIVLKEGCQMMPVYLTNSSKEYSYETIGDDDEKSYKTKFTGTHPGTELQALEFTKNMIEQPFLVLIPSCRPEEPSKLLGEICNPLIFTSNHKANREGAKFTFNFEQRIGSENIYFSYGGVYTAPEVPDGNPPPGSGSAFDPALWAKRNADNISDENVIPWRDALELYSKSEIDALVNALKDDRVLTIGAITATTTSIDIALHSSGINSVEMNGNTLSKNTAEHWEFPEVTAEKVFQIYAEDTPAIFGLAEDGEEIPAGALIVATIALSEAGVPVINEPTAGFKLKANDAWVRTWVNYTTDIQTLSIHHAALRFIVQAGHDGVKIGGFQFYKPEFLYDGVEITLRNETLGDLELATATESGYNLVPINPADLPAKLKIGESCTLAYNAYANVFNVQKMGGGGGSASFPEVGNDGDILEKDSTAEGGVKWSDRLTTAKSEIDTEIVNRALEDSIEKNERIAADNAEALARVNADALKLDKPTISSDFLNYPDIVAVNSLGETAKISGGSADFQALLFTENMSYILPSGGGGSYITVKSTGGALVGAGGYEDDVVLGVSYTTASSTVAHMRGNAMKMYLNKTSKWYRNFKIFSNTPTKRVMIGLSQNYYSTAPTSIPISTLTNCIAICMESGDDKLYLVHNDATGSATMVDTGFTHNSAASYGFTLQTYFGDTNVYVTLDRTVGGIITRFSHTITGDRPTTGLYMCAVLWAVDTLAATTVTVIDFGILALNRRTGL